MTDLDDVMHLGIYIVMFIHSVTLQPNKSEPRIYNVILMNKTNKNINLLFRMIMWCQSRDRPTHQLPLWLIVHQ